MKLKIEPEWKPQGQHTHNASGSPLKEDNHNICRDISLYQCEEENERQDIDNSDLNKNKYKGNNDILVIKDSRYESMFTEF